MKSRLLLALILLASCAPDPAVPPTQEIRKVESGLSAPAALATDGSAAPTSARPSTKAAPADPVLAVDGEGVRLFDRATGSARVLAFGQPRAFVLGALEKLRGPAGKGVNQDCGAGPVEYANWADGLSLVFQDGKFAGWGLDGRAAGAIVTASNIGPGSTRAALEDAYTATVEQSTLGTEWRAGAMSGLLDGRVAKARITDMWAGVNCAAR